MFHMKIKKLIAVLLTTCAFAAGTPSSSRLYANAVNLDDIVIDIDASLEQEYEFTLKNDGTYEISGYIREIEENPVFTPSPDIYLPKSYKGKPVTSIGDHAFCTNNFDYITGTVNIPSSITSIGKDAFYLCNFTNCVIPESVTSIGISSFSKTPYLDNLRKQNPVVIVNNVLLDAKTASGDVVLPNTLTTIPSYTFTDNELVKSVYIPDSVKEIAPHAFDGCKSLEKFNFPKDITEINNWTFSYCESLRGPLTIPSNVSSIGECAFWSCKNLTSVNIPNGVTYIGGSAFKFCLSVTEVSVPDSVKVIEGCAFSENHKLENIVIPASVELIGQGCFRYDYSLDYVKILNPNCEIYDDDDTFPAYTVIYGYENSTAHEYAIKYDRKFVSLGESSVPRLNKGDINGDGTVDSSDAAVVLIDYSLTSTGKGSALTDAQKSAADIDKDGKIDASDASFILRFYSYVSTGGTVTDMSKWLNNLL